MNLTRTPWYRCVRIVVLVFSLCAGTAVAAGSASAGTGQFPDVGGMVAKLVPTGQAISGADKPAFLNLSVESANAMPAERSASAAAHRTVYNGASGSKVVVRGKSTLHNWSVLSSTLNGKMIVSGYWSARPGQAVGIELLHLSIPVATLKGSDGSGMTHTIMHALHRKQHPLITFTVTQAKLLRRPKTRTGNYLFRATGLLKINGIMRRQAMTLRIRPMDHGRLTVQTVVKLKMRDFNVTPPTAMFGIIRSSNHISVSATWRLAKAVRSGKLAHQ